MNKRLHSRRNRAELPSKPAARKVMNMTSAPIKGWMEYNFEAELPLNSHELTSITALITYLAYTTKQSEFYIERQFADRFNIPNVKCLPSDRYEDAVRYLVDQVPVNSSATA